MTDKDPLDRVDDALKRARVALDSLADLCPSIFLPRCGIYKHCIIDTQATGHPMSATIKYGRF